MLYVVLGGNVYILMNCKCRYTVKKNARDVQTVNWSGCFLIDPATYSPSESYGADAQRIPIAFYQTASLRVQLEHPIFQFENNYLSTIPTSTYLTAFRLHTTPRNYEGKANVNQGTTCQTSKERR